MKPETAGIRSHPALGRNAVVLGFDLLKRLLPLPIKFWIWKSLGRYISPIADLEMRLWGGFSHDALGAIETLADTPQTPTLRRSEALLLLARWHAFNERFAQALDLLAQREDIDRKASRDRRHMFLKVLFALRGGNVQAAKQAFEAPQARWLRESASGPLFRTELALSNPAENGNREEAALDALNSLFAGHGLSRIRKAREYAPLTLDNLTGHEVAKHYDPDVLVSIIVPVYNGEATIETALRALAEQSWTNIEVIVVDDASTDNSKALIAAFCAGDLRFRLLRRNQNGGSYAARNDGLKLARGRYVTIHDADDWAHPDRIAVQVRHLLASRRRHTMAMWARCTSALSFVGPWRPKDTLLSANMGSHMFERSLSEQLGSWDTARISADSEFLRRIASGSKAGVARLYPRDCPLVLGRVAAESLTQAKATHLSTFNHGIRQDYLESAALWHARVRGGAPGQPPYFPSPKSIASQRADPHADILIVGDWNAAPNSSVAWSSLETAYEYGVRIAAFQYQHLQHFAPRSLTGAARSALWERAATIVAAGEKAAAQIVVLAQPELFMHPLDRFPQIEWQHLVAVGENDEDTSLRAHHISVFGAPPIWISAADLGYTLSTLAGQAPAGSGTR